jgi:hypothetical protein
MPLSWKMRMAATTITKELAQEDNLKIMNCQNPW